MTATGDFAVGRCGVCRREVLTYPDGDGAVRRCIHCDQRLAGELRWVDVGDLEGLGYGVEAGESGCVSCTAKGCDAEGGRIPDRRGER